jgi:flavin-dependent dehydrogenase
MHFTIIGSSIAGASAACELTEEHDVTVLEEHSHFKKTCSGIVTHALDDLHLNLPKSILIGKADRIRINAPNKKQLEVKLKKPDYVYDREKLNEYFAHKAVDQGAKLIQPARFTGVQGKKITYTQGKDKKIKQFSTDHLIGADGAQSSVAKATELFNNRKFFLGVKAYVKMDHDQAIDVFPDHGLFSWIVPHQDTVVEVGTFCYLNQAKTFEKFLKHVGVQESKIVSKEGALIPVYNPKARLETTHNGLPVTLLGDASTMVKATTGGSIFQSLVAARVFAKSVKQGIKDGKRGGVYTKAVRSKVGRDLWLHLKMRQSLDKLQEKDWNELVERFSKPSTKTVLETQSRDYPLLLLMKLFSRNPGLIKYGKFLL